MTWAKGPNRASRVPAAVRRAVRSRDHDRCQLAYPGCTGWYEQLDHRINLATLGLSRQAPEANTVDLLQCVCTHCHTVKTRREAMDGRTWWKRQPEQHPGIIR